MRNPDFRERIDAIEKFQIMCETETDLAITNLVMVRIEHFFFVLILWLIINLYFEFKDF